MAKRVKVKNSLVGNINAGCNCGSKMSSLFGKKSY